MSDDDRETMTESGADDDEIKIVGRAVTNGQGGMQMGSTDGWELADWTVDAETETERETEAEANDAGDGGEANDDDGDVQSPIPDGFPRTRVNQGGYGEWVDREDGKEWVEWSNFVIEPLAMVETVGGEQRLELIVHPRDGEAFATAVSPTVFNDVRAFKGQLCTRMSTTWYGSQSDLDQLKSALGRVDVPHKHGTDHLGYHPDDRVWVTPNGNIDGDGHCEESTLEYVTRDIVPERAWSCVEEYDEEVVCQILELLPRMRDPDRFLPVLGWFYAATFRPLIVDWTGQFNMLFITGETGSGKTATIETLWELFGMDSGPFSVTDTAFTMDTTMGCTNSIPIWYDEFKPSDLATYQIDRFLDKARKATRGGVAQRGNADLSSNQYRLAAPIVVSGEERMHGSAEERRAIFTTFKKSTTEPGSETARVFAELIGGSVTVNGMVDRYEGYDLSQHALAWYEHLVGLGPESLRSDWDEAGQQVNGLLLDHGIDPAELEDLVLQGLQTIRFGLCRYRGFCSLIHAPHPFDDDVIDSALLYVLKDSIGGLNRTDHIDTLVNVAARAASEGYLHRNRHYAIVNGTELRLNLHRALDPIRKYANEYDIPDDLLASKSDYDRRITDVIDNHPYLTCRSQNTPPINRAIGIDLVAAKAAIDGFDLGVFEGHYRFKRNQEEF